MGCQTQHIELLRILLADDDDLHSFVLQCTISRLSQPTAFQRVGKREALAEKLQSFAPEFLVLAGSFAAPGQIQSIRQLTTTLPLICLVNSTADAEAALAAGAADCVLRTHEDELGACLEKHFDGTFREPHFRSQARPQPASRISRAEYKLKEFDRRVGAWLRQIAAAARVKWTKLQHAAKAAWNFTQAEAARRYKQLKVQYLLRKQHRLIRSQSQAPSPLPEFQQRTIHLPGEQPHPGHNGSTARSVQPRVSAAHNDAPLHDRALFDESNDALRTLELSFKTLFHSALDPMFLVDGLGAILHVNPAACALLGAAPVDLLGRSILEVVPESYKARASAFWEAFLIEGQQKSDLVIETTGGEIRDIYLFGRTNLWFGVHLLIARDQTELKTLRASRAAAV